MTTTRRQKQTSRIKTTDDGSFCSGCGKKLIEGECNAIITLQGGSICFDCLMKKKKEKNEQDTAKS